MLQETIADACFEFCLLQRRSCTARPSGAGRKPMNWCSASIRYLSPNQIVEQFTPLSDHSGHRSGPTGGTALRAGFRQVHRAHPRRRIRHHLHRPAHGTSGRKTRRLSSVGAVRLIRFIVHRPGEEGFARQDRSTIMRDRGLAVGAKLSMTYQVMNQALGKAGLELGKKREASSTPRAFPTYIEAVLRGEADAGAHRRLCCGTTPPPSSVPSCRKFTARNRVPRLFAARPSAQRRGDAEEAASSTDRFCRNTCRQNLLRQDAADRLSPAGCRDHEAHRPLHRRVRMHD